MALMWADNLSVGNATIDFEHRNLIAMVNNIGQILKEDGASALLQELEQIEYWLCTHFKNEERIALAVGIDVTQSKLEHQNLLKDFHRMKDELRAMNGMWSDKLEKQYFQFLCDWIMDHVLEEDMLMKPVLQTHEYFFQG